MPRTPKRAALIPKPVPVGQAGLILRDTGTHPMRVPSQLLRPLTRLGRYWGQLLAVLVSVMPPAALFAQAATAEPRATARQPLWPLKTARTLYSDEQITRARELTRTRPDARAVLAKILRAARPWLSFSNDELRRLLPDSRVPRAFEVSTEGCPKHGKTIYRHGTYPWKVDASRAFVVTCPVGGEQYPSNDFRAFYEGGMKDRGLLTGPYADDGRGWVSPGGEKYWFVAYACHGKWKQHWIPAILTLSQAYILTGERAYAEKAIVLLDRVAEVYPAMDYDKQSRFGEMASWRYPGKILNYSWECLTLRDLAISYDLVFDQLAGDKPVNLPWRDAHGIRAQFEANVLEEGLAALDRGDIQSNFGVHQNTYIHVLAVRQHAPTDELLTRLLREKGDHVNSDGIEYALYNKVSRDGMPLVTSPYYGFIWVKSLIELAPVLEKLGFSLYEHPRMRFLFDAPLRIICGGDFTPAIGDAGAISDKWIGASAEPYEEVYRHFQEPRYAWAIHRLNGPRPVNYFIDLFEKPIDRAAFQKDLKAYADTPPSRLLDGYGLAILNNRKNTLAVSLYYGDFGAHAHHDRLNMEFFGLRRRLSPDLGYPDAMNQYVSGIYGWTKNTVSHNCLVVNDSAQPGRSRGRVLRFCDTPTAKLVDVQAAGIYSGTSEYRRTLLLNETSPDAGYLIDLWRVRGGKNYTLSMHGNEGQFKLEGAELSLPVTQGTLAGRDVAYGFLYDDPALSHPGFKGGFGSYLGSGYSHLFNWQKATPMDTVTGCWSFPGPAPGGLRVHVLPSAGQEIVVADAYVSPVRKDKKLKYMLARRKASPAGDVFACIWEPAGSPTITKVSWLDDPSLGHGDRRVAALLVERGKAVDVIAIAPDSSRGYEVSDWFSADCAAVVLTVEDGRLVRLFGMGGSIIAGGQPRKEFRLAPPIEGTIVSVDYERRSIQVKVNAPLANAAALAGRTVGIGESRPSMYQIGGVRPAGQGTWTLDLDGSDLITGRLKVASVDGSNSFTTLTTLPFPENLIGMWVLDEAFQPLGKVVTIESGRVRLAPAAIGTQVDLKAQVGKDVWVTEVGTSDPISIESVFHLANF